ncbi:hypothetical protein GO755_36730 [Spirosoma sp. HMF4905]|uniref:Uncharacterized protein n=1 Tax=Spirosoma arboris TaxID=2682092 RepID=A0A7K1SPA7_9BACT|nr:hypothetical protein [Spirosoma arboris]MVM35621.1 hypothetical protein [Spirosoma arboris]
MEHSVPNEHLPSTNGFDSILADWLEAIDRLYAYYLQLHTCLREATTQQGGCSEASTHIGQCPKNQLVQLISTMQSELLNLTQDIDLVETRQQAIQERVCAKLARHTRRLNQLNYQASTRLGLIKRSSS